MDHLDSQALARYIESINGISKPWLLGLLRLKKLQEKKETISPEDYDEELADIHRDLMKLGEWWVGIEDEVFGD